MPDFSGYDVINELVKENKIKDQKIIVLTASILDEDAISKLKKSGVYSIQKKPMNVSTLVEMIA